jgi:hypothetical protein
VGGFVEREVTSFGEREVTSIGEREVTSFGEKEVRLFGEREVTSVCEVPMVVIIYVYCQHFNIKIQVFNMQLEVTAAGTVSQKLCVVEGNVLLSVFWFGTFPDLQFL